MPLHIGLNLITLLEKCKCEFCQKELKKIKEKYGLDEVNKAEGESHRERLNPMDHIEDNLEMVCESPNSENK